MSVDPTEACVTRTRTFLRLGRARRDLADFQGLRPAEATNPGAQRFGHHSNYGTVCIVCLTSWAARATPPSTPPSPRRLSRCCLPRGTRRCPSTGSPKSPARRARCLPSRQESRGTCHRPADPSLRHFACARHRRPAPRHRTRPRNSARLLRRCIVRAGLAGLLSDTYAEPALGAVLYDRFLAPRRRSVAAMLARAAERGQIATVDDPARISRHAHQTAPGFAPSYRPSDRSMTRWSKPPSAPPSMLFPATDGRQRNESA